MRESKLFMDQLNREVLINFPPKRIISLVPSQTELLFHLGLEDQIVGITKFCVHPADKVSKVQKIGGTKNVNLDRIRTLNPDLIIANKEENDKIQIEQLASEFPVWISDVKNLERALEMIDMVGKIVFAMPESLKLIKLIKKGFKNNLPEKLLPEPIPTAYFIWRKPFMAAGSGTFINDLLKTGGFLNVFKEEERYPEITMERLKIIQPKLIFLSSEPFPFKEKHISEFRKICPTSVIKLVDGEVFSWYGSRLLQAPNYLAKLRQEIKTS